MALKRRSWNNIIILICILMVSVLTLLDKRMHSMPDDSAPLFDSATPLTALQLDGISLERRDDGFVCDTGIQNCNDWGKAWLALRVSRLASTPPAPAHARELTIHIGNLEPQAWLLFDDGLLKSPQGHWYQIPPSLRPTLEPQLEMPPH